jgi:ubiquinone/menaquinone biosynthesis C-methylase UbiE
MSIGADNRAPAVAAAFSESIDQNALQPAPPPKLVEGLPDYARYQAAYHRAFRAELQQLLAEVFPDRARSALDMACGDGTYAGWLSQLFGAEAVVVAMDTNLSYLRAASRQPASQSLRGEPHVAALASNALKLPFADNSFDVVWCAQSLYSLPDSTAVLQEMRRVTRPGGRAAVLENDTLHEVVLPWPPALELAIRQAELAAFRRESAEPDKYYMGRYLPQEFHAAGFTSCSVRTYAVSRTGLPDPDVREFLIGYLARLGERVEPYLTKRQLALFHRLLSPGEPTYLLDRTDFTLTCLNYAAWAIK